MANTVYMLDGKCKVIFCDDDVLDIVQEYAGKGIRDLIEEIIRMNDAKQSELDDLQDQVYDHEEELQECEDAFRDIVKTCREFNQIHESDMLENEWLHRFYDSVYKTAYEMT